MVVLFTGNSVKCEPKCTVNVSILKTRQSINYLFVIDRSRVRKLNVQLHFLVGSITSDCVPHRKNSNVI